MKTFKHGLGGWVKGCKCVVCKRGKADAQARYRVNMTPESKAKQLASNNRYRARQKAG